MTSIPEVINGIRLQVVADVATDSFDPRIKCGGIGPDDDLDEAFGPGLVAPPTEDERVIAKTAKNTLDKLRRKGYAREQCRLGFWNKIVSEANRLGTQAEDEKK